ncbi:hypothetical protein DEO72_LG6g1359 [Vigna unguiculata]|uniref:Uncharacterized protein n=1 Tax=Vigna unguiculata TaxID=3917 RepID=A0A4D6M5S9_VIGUN|nr:hypothetical protein DEO72_LG6g1359 [Vigna unguiculata]
MCCHCAAPATVSASRRRWKLFSCHVAATPSPSWSRLERHEWAVSYTHLDVYKRERGARSSSEVGGGRNEKGARGEVLCRGRSRGRRDVYKRQPPPRSRPRQPAVSYTHLDVYKRERGARSSSEVGGGRNEKGARGEVLCRGRSRGRRDVYKRQPPPRSRPRQPAVSYTHLDVYKRERGARSSSEVGGGRNEKGARGEVLCRGGDRVCFSAKRIGKLALWDRCAAEGEHAVAVRWVEEETKMGREGKCFAEVEVEVEVEETKTPFCKFLLLC